MAATARAVDLTNIKENNFRTKRVPEGDYRAKIVKADDHQPNDKSKGPGWVMTVQIEGYARYSYPVYLNPAEKERWKIWQICRAAGLNVKNAKVKFNPNILVGKEIGVAMEDEEYEGRPKSVIADMFPASEVGANADEDEDEVVIDEEEVEEEEEPPPPPRKRTARKPAPEPEEEEDEEEEEEEEEPAPPPRRRRKAAAPPPVEEDEDEEDEPAPPPRKRTTTTRRKAAPPPDDDDDLDEIDTDDLDD